MFFSLTTSKNHDISFLMKEYQKEQPYINESKIVFCDKNLSILNSRNVFPKKSQFFIFHKYNRHFTTPEIHYFKNKKIT